MISAGKCRLLFQLYIFINYYITNTVSIWKYVLRYFRAFHQHRGINTCKIITGMIQTKIFMNSNEDFYWFKWRFLLIQMKMFIDSNEDFYSSYLRFIWTRLNECLDINLCSIRNTGTHNKYTPILKARDDSSMHNVFRSGFCRLLFTV